MVKISFEKFKEDYLEYSRGKQETEVLFRDECSLKHLSKFFGGKMLSDINPFLVEKYKLNRKEEEANPRRSTGSLRCLRHMFNMAIEVEEGSDQSGKRSQVSEGTEGEGEDSNGGGGSPAPGGCQTHNKVTTP